MALQLIPAPPAVWSVYEEALLDMFGPHDPEAQSYYLPVGMLDAEGLAAGATLADINASGCRIVSAWGKFVPGLDGAVTSSELTNATVDVQARFRNFAHGDLPAIVFERITTAKDLAPVQAQDFELHFLSIPGVQLQALHLVGQARGSDLILPVLSGDPRLTTDAVLAANDFLALARAIASERLAMHTDDLSS
jgi:hypothetical protein